MVEELEERINGRESVAATGRNGLGDGVTTAWMTMNFFERSGGAPLPPITGQRDPAARFDILDVDFSGKTYLDIGCNTGGMILHQLPYVRKAVGVDFDATAATVLDGIRHKLGLGNDVLQVHSFDHTPSINCDDNHNEAVCAERQCEWTTDTPDGRGMCQARSPEHQHGLPLTIRALPLEKALEYGATPEGPNFNEDGKYDIVSMFSVNQYMEAPVAVMLWAMDHARRFIVEVDGSDGQKTELIDALMARCPGTQEKTDASRCSDCSDRRMFTVTQQECWPGCMNNAATNYESRATMDDGSCIIPGCMTSTATNYNNEATSDDGSCYTMNADGSCDCTGCYTGTSGVCRQSNNVCHPFDNSGECPPMTTLCGCPV